MLHNYRVITKTFHNGELIGSSVGSMITDKEMPKEEYNFTWDNLEEQYKEFGCGVQFNIWNMKKGRRVSFFTDKFFPTGNHADVKEWKTKDLNITVTVEYHNIDKFTSIQDVLRWHDNEKAIQYLTERGLSISK